MRFPNHAIAAVQRRRETRVDDRLRRRHDGEGARTARTRTPREVPLARARRSFGYAWLPRYPARAFFFFAAFSMLAMKNG